MVENHTNSDKIAKPEAKKDSGHDLAASTWKEMEHVSVAKASEKDAEGKHTLVLTDPFKSSEQGSKERCPGTQSQVESSKDEKPGHGTSEANHAKISESSVTLKKRHQAENEPKDPEVSNKPQPVGDGDKKPWAVDGGVKKPQPSDGIENKPQPNDGNKKPQPVDSSDKKPLPDAVAPTLHHLDAPATKQ